MQYKKYPEVVAETDDAYICTIWTGPNYYIGRFSKSEIDSYIQYAKECGVYVTLNQVIARTHVDEMRFMCRTEDFSDDLLNEWIAFLLNPDGGKGNE